VRIQPEKEVITQLLCIPGQDFTRAAAKRQVWIMRTNMTILTQIWMMLLLSKHSVQRPQYRSPPAEVSVGIAPARHPVDSEKSNRVLGFPALIMSLCQFYGMPVTPSKVIKPPINRAFIKKYCTPRQEQGETPQQVRAPQHIHKKIRALPTTHGRPIGDQVQSQR